MDKIVIQYNILFIIFNSIMFLLELDQMVIISSFLFILDVYLFFRNSIKYHPKEFRNYANPIYIIFLSLVIVNLQNCVNQFFDYIRINDIMFERYGKYLYQVFYLGEICIAGFMLGIYCYRKHIYNINTAKQPSFLWFWVIISVLALLMFIMNIDVAAFIAGAVYRNSGAADRVMDASNYYETILNISLIICFSIITKQNLDKKLHTIIEFIKSIPLIIWIVVFIYVFLRMVSGDRGPVVYTLAVIFYSYIISNGITIKLKQLIILLFIGGSIFFTLGIVRDSNLNDSFEERVIKAITTDKQRDYKSIMPATQELANSSNCNYIALYDIDNNKTSFQLGKYMIFGIISGIPGSSFILSQLLGVDLRDKSVLEYITISYFGKYYTMGLGGTPLAEFYLDFGIFGVIIGSIILGIIFRWISLRMTYKVNALTVRQLIVILKISSISIYIPRSTLSGTISSVVYILIVYSIVNYVLIILYKMIPKRSNYKSYV